MQTQKHLFTLPDTIHYLNGAYMSPNLKAAEEAGILGMQRKRDPSQLKAIDFFSQTAETKNKFSRIIHCKPEQVAIIPSASYGLKSAVSNISPSNGSHVVTIADEFPSGHYTVVEWCKKHNKEQKTIKAPVTTTNRGKEWNEKIINAINEDTAAVVMSAIHWTDGTLFDLKRIGEKCRQSNALFIVDGSQATGIIPLNVSELKIDALITAGYKWLFGFYTIGLAYYGEAFQSGEPIENSWMNRINAGDFTRLTAYTDEYKPGAARFDVGETSNFIMVGMLNTGLDQLLEWGVKSVQGYSANLVKPLINYLRENNYWLEEDAYRAHHLFGFLLPAGKSREAVLKELQEKKIIVSTRGDAIRVSTHVYNTEEDIDVLIKTLRG
jgi:selenocysteine lyase/cysteine desulfurase